MYKLVITQHLADGTRADSIRVYSDKQRAKIEMMREIVYGFDAHFVSISTQILGEKGEYIANENCVYNNPAPAPEILQEEQMEEPTANPEMMLEN